MKGLSRNSFIVSFAVLCGVLFYPPTIKSADFSSNFSDSTLRVDYIFAGGPNGPQIYIDSSCKQAGWAGRKGNLKEVPAKGNGTIMVLDPNTGDTLYINSFSTLFQEWIVTPEASTEARSFENSFLLPLPKRDADIFVELRNNRQQPVATMKHRYRSDDELVGIVGRNPLPHHVIFGDESADAQDVIDIAFLAEGYTNAELDTFLNRAAIITKEIFSYEPFASNKEKFRVVAVETPSPDSGVSIPLKNEWRDTAFGSHFSTFYSARYLTVPRVKKMHQALEGIPYEHILVLVNTPQYGGGGIFNSYQVASADNEYTLPVAVHEFGHSFAGLADEYFYAGEEDDSYIAEIEPWESNITTLKDFQTKWADKIGAGTPVPTPWDKEKKATINPEENIIGVYEGAGYKTHGVYRPFITCRMKDNFYPQFCEVCQDAITQIIDFYTSE